MLYDWNTNSADCRRIGRQKYTERCVCVCGACICPERNVSAAARMAERQKMFLSKLSFRPTIQELQEKQIIAFNNYVKVADAERYDRRASYKMRLICKGDVTVH